MTTRADFSESEWQTIRQPLGMIPAAVMRAAPGGTVRELFEVVNLYASAMLMFSTDLSQSLLNTPFDTSGAPQPAPNERRYTPPEVEPFAGMLWHAIRDAVTIVEAKSTLDEQGEYKSLLLSIADRMARAGKEEGFLGFDGRALTEEEKALLLQISDAVGLEWQE